MDDFFFSSSHQDDNLDLKETAVMIPTNTQDYNGFPFQDCFFFINISYIRVLLYFIQFYTITVCCVKDSNLVSILCKF